jgi:hypothetical protein
MSARRADPRCAFGAHRASTQAGTAWRVRAAGASGATGYASVGVVVVGAFAHRHYRTITAVRAARCRRRGGGRDEEDEAANAACALHDV